MRREYDDRGNIIAIEDPNGSATRYEYDRNNRLIKIIKPMGQETIYGYDESGNRTQLLDAKGQKVVYVYDELNRCTRINFFSVSNHTTPYKVTEFVYDQLGNLVGYNDGITSATYEYDDLQRKISETVNYGAFSQALSYSYYANGRKRSFTGPDAITYGYIYDENTRVSRVDTPLGGAIAFNAYQWNSPAKATVPGGSTTNFQYDQLMRVKSIRRID